MAMMGAFPMPTVEDLHVLDGMSRDELIDRARSLGAKRPELMTRVELRDEIVRLTEQDPIVRRRSRGWLGVARDLVASVMDSGLNLPGAAAAIRGGAAPKPEWQGPAPVATVTLAEIYIAQGHPERALAVLDEVLRSEPDHAAALALRERLASDRTGRGRIVDVTSTVSVPEAPQATPTREPGETLGGETSLGEAGSYASVAAPTGEPPPSGASDWGLPEAAPAEAPPVAASLGTPHAYPPEPVDDGVWPACALAVTKSALAVRYELERLMDGVTLKVLSFVPRPEGPERLEIDVPVDVIETSGGLSLPPPPPGAVVRAVLGVGSNGDFKPLAVAWVYDASGPAMALAFAPPGKEPRTLRANLEAAVRVGVLG
jgi:tetratricopeptide repeat protein